MTDVLDTLRKGTGFEDHAKSFWRNDNSFAEPPSAGNYEVPKAAPISINAGAGLVLTANASGSACWSPTISVDGSYIISQTSHLEERIRKLEADLAFVKNTAESSSNTLREVRKILKTEEGASVIGRAEEVMGVKRTTHITKLPEGSKYTHMATSLSHEWPNVEQTVKPDAGYFYAPYIPVFTNKIIFKDEKKVTAEDNYARAMALVE